MKCNKLLRICSVVCTLYAMLFMAIHEYNMPTTKATQDMGCSPSLASTDIAGTDLRLPNSKLRFSVNQLKILNEKLKTLNVDLNTPLLSDDAESIAERLIQGLVCGASTKDPRYKSKFIVVLHKERICKSNSLEYLVLLDALDGNCAFGEGPPGCARLRPQDHILSDWQEFLTPTGFLRRDKIIERWVEVLAAAAADGVLGSGSSSDYSTAPGHLVSPVVLQKLRNLEPQAQCFYGNVREGGQFPSSRDYRIAIVEGSPWVRVRLAGGALGSGTEAKLALGIAFHGWPSGSDFPSRIPLGHPDALLFYKAAQTGFFVVGGGPGPNVQWSERSAGWQVWPCGARSILAARGDGVLKVGQVCGVVLDHLRATGQPPLRAASRFMIEELLLWRAEKPSGRGVAGDLRSWTSNHLAHHVLCIFDILLGDMRAKYGRHYFFSGCDTIKMTVWRGARIGERDWRGDVDCLAGFLRRLHEESYQKIEEGVEIFTSSQERLESALCCRWGLLLQELTPAGSTKGRRLAGAPPYSPRQLAYVAATSRELLAARQLLIQESSEWFQGNLSSTSSQNQDPVEDLIHLLAIILDQARDYFIKVNFNDSSLNKTLPKNVLLNPSSGHSKDTIKKQKLKNCFDASATYLLDSIRRDAETQKEDLLNDSVLVRTLLKWLYKAVDDDKKCLSPVLKPYLDLLFNTSHENCWHLEEFKLRMCERELESLNSFCKLVGEGSLSPADGVLDAATKGWQWAENMLDTLDNLSNSNSALRVLFMTPDNKVLKFDLSLPNDPYERDNWNMFHANRYDGHMGKLKLAEKCVVEAFTYGLDQDEPNLESHYACKSEEILCNKDKCSYFDGSTTHTLRSVNGTIYSDQQSDTASKYMTLRSIDSKYNTLRNSENLFGSMWSSGNTLKFRDKLKRPMVFGKLGSTQHEEEYDDEDLEYSLHSYLREVSPMTLVLTDKSQLAPHREYTGIIKALITMQKYSVLQELAGWLGNKGEKTGALKALHRLARGGRRYSGPPMSSKQKPQIQKNNYTLTSPKKIHMQHKQRASIRQYYRKRNTEVPSGDESNQKNDTKSVINTELIQESQRPSSLQSKYSERLDLEVQEEYLKNKSLHETEDIEAINDRYMELCKEAIKESQARLNKSSFSKFDKEMRSKCKVSRKSSRLSSSMGKSDSKELKTYLNDSRVSSTQTLGRNFNKDMQVSANSLLGTCRKARLHQANRNSILPRASSVGDGLIGDAFKVSPIYSGVHSEYDLMTQSILQNSSSPNIPDRQRQLVRSNDKIYL